MSTLPFLQVLFADLLKLLLLGGALLYAGLVLMSYRIEGPRAPLRLDIADPARAFERLMVRMGVKILDAVLRNARRFLDLLAEASAEVGAWFIERRSAKVQETVRSRFMI
ncbi:MAG: hypothetical protein LAP13_09655 [Acidobacteriia bacterium]|nr:hypothetical protein [Terriglobia bacterium]